MERILTQLKNNKINVIVVRTGLPDGTGSDIGIESKEKGTVVLSNSKNLDQVVNSAAKLAKPGMYIDF